MSLKLLNEPDSPTPGRKPAGDFKSFVSAVNSRFCFYEHCTVLADVLERVAAGEIKRLLIQLPPRHSKSELVSRLFSAYFLSKNPQKFAGITSYSAELAFTLSRAARENFLEAGGSIKEAASAVKHWETSAGGGCWAAGVGGSITGKGFHLGIIDDPIKNAEDANSETIRAKQKEWYSSTFYTRAEPDAAIIVIQTRWHEDDLTGWLLENEQGENTENWHVVCFPALSEELPEFPESCTVETDFRNEENLALCPERYDAEKLRKIRDRLGEYFFDALFQQRPSPKTGAFFDVSKIEIIDALPANIKATGRGWDKASTKGGGDYTAGVKMSKTAEGIFIVEDVVRGQWDTAQRDRIIRQMAEIDGRNCKIIGEQEPGSGGKDAALAFIRLLSGFSVECKPSTANKTARADAFSSQVNAGNVKLLRSSWNKVFLEELRSFPHGRNDDQADGASLIFNKLNAGGSGLIVF